MAKFLNFTEEACTGTAATLALAGATSGMLPFVRGLADGDEVYYVVEDSGGVIKIAGVGTYVSATDDITRNDTWNDNGTTTDDNPSTNITLSGGTHTVRCDVIGRLMYKTYAAVITDNTTGQFVGSEISSEADLTLTVGSTQANEVYIMPFKTSFAGLIDAFVCEVRTAAVGGADTLTVRMGIYEVDASTGRAGKLLIDSAEVSITTTGVKEATLNGGGDYYLAEGMYYVAFIAGTNGVTTSPAFTATAADSQSPSPLGVGANLDALSYTRTVADQTWSSAMPSDLSAESFDNPVIGNGIRILLRAA